MHCRWWHPDLAYKKNTKDYILLKTLKNSCGMTSAVVSSLSACSILHVESFLVELDVAATLQ